MLGHELRNPLAPIHTALQLMRLRGDGSAERERAVIERQVKHLTRLVDDLLDVSRIVRGKVELKRERVNISDVIAKAIELASPLIEQRRHTLDVQVPRQGLLVDGDSLRLAQVLSNLFANAAKYTEQGGTVTVVAERIGNKPSYASAITAWVSPRTCCRGSLTSSFKSARRSTDHKVDSASG